MYDIYDNVKHVLIYGAMDNARHAVNVVEYLWPGKLVGLAVSNKEENTHEIFGHKVRAIDDYEGELDKKSTLVIIAVRQSLVGSVKKSLEDNGYHCCISFGTGEDVIGYLPKKILDEFASYAKLKNFLMRKRFKDTFARFRKSEMRDGI